jgi:hypothetical protein
MLHPVPYEMWSRTRDHRDDSTHSDQRDHPAIFQRDCDSTRLDINYISWPQLMGGGCPLNSTEVKTHLVPFATPSSGRMLTYALACCARRRLHGPQKSICSETPDNAVAHRGIHLGAGDLLCSEARAVAQHIKQKP